MKADTADIQQQKQEQLSSLVTKLKSQVKELDEDEVGKQKRNELLQLELEKRRDDYENLSKFAEIQAEIDAKKNDVYLSEQENQMKKQIEKKVIEKLNFHMDKYYQYIDTNISTNVLEEQGEIENQYQPPPPTSAIQVKCLKSNFGKKNLTFPIPGDDEDYVMATFRYSKKETMESLKERALRYWNLIENQHQDNKGDGASSSQHISSMTGRFEIVAEDLTPITNTDFIERYLNSVSSNQAITFFTVVLRKKRQKAAHKKVAINDKSSVDPKSQVKSGQQTYTEKLQSTNAVTNTNLGQSGLGQSMVQSENNDGHMPLVEEADDDDDDEMAMTDEQVARMKIPLFQKYIAFFKRFPVLKKMFVINPLTVEQKGIIQQKQIKLVKKGMGCDDNNVCVIVLLAILFTLNAVFLHFLDDGPYVYSHINQLSKYLIIGDSGQVGSFKDITTLSDVYSYLADLNGFAYQLCEPSSSLNQNYETIGALRIRQIRLKQTKCKYPVRTDRESQVKCAYQFQAPDTIETEELYDGSQSWMYFKAVSEVGISRVIKGDFGQYDSSGYINDINKKNLTLKYYSKNVVTNMLDKNDYLSFQTYAIIWTFTLRCKNDGAFLFMEFLVEYSSMGVFPKAPTIIPFTPNIFGFGLSEPYSIIGQKNTAPPTNPIDYKVGVILYVINIMKVIIGLFYILFIILKIVNQFSDEQKSKELKYFISLTFILNLLVVFTNYQSVADAFSHANLNLDMVQLQNADSFIDLGDAAQLYQTLKLEICACLCVLLIRIFFLLNFFRNLEAAIGAIESQYLQLFASFIMLGFNLIGFTFVGMSIWGPYIQEFSTAMRALTSLILLTIGCFNKAQLTNYNLEIAVVYVICFYFLIFTFMFNILAVIYIDSYRLLIINEGELTQEEWTISDWIQWATSWVPQSIKKHFNKALEAVQNQNED